MRYTQGFLFCIALFGFWATPANASPMVVFNEVVYDGPGSDADDVFTELFGNPHLSLDGWSITATNGSNGVVYRTIDLTQTVIPFDGVLVLATSSAAGAVLAARDFIANVDWQNGADSIQLLDHAGFVIDALQYGDAGIYNRGEGTPALDVASGFSLSRDEFGTDTNNNALDFAGLATPTPGLGPTTSSVPEPTTFALIGLGMLGFAFRRRAVNAGVPPITDL